MPLLKRQVQLLTDCSLIPIPAMRSFCLQVAIVLVFNLLSIITLFPAVMCIDLLRRRHNLMDLFCCFRGWRFWFSDVKLTIVYCTGRVKKHHEVTIVDYSLLAGSRRFSLMSLASLLQPHSHYKPLSTHREHFMRGSVVDSIASPPIDDDEIASLSTGTCTELSYRVENNKLRLHCSGIARSYS